MIEQSEHDRTRPDELSVRMILTCPACASRYVVDDATVGPEGRNVRCSNCKTLWKAQASTEAPTVKLEPDVKELVQPAAPADLPGEALPKQFRARVKAEKQARRAAAAGAVWGGMAAAMAAVMVTAVVFRTDVARVWPNTASAYAAVGLQVNTVGLVVEDLETSPAIENGRTAVVISGLVRNVSDAPVSSPKLRVDLLDEHGARLLGQGVDIGAEPVPEGQARPFTISLWDPPVSAAEVEAAFVLGSAAAKDASLEKDQPHAAKPDHSGGDEHAADGHVPDPHG